MIRFRGIDGGNAWSCRFDTAGAAGDFVIPPPRKVDSKNPAGTQWTFRERGQLILLGLTGRVRTMAADSGVSLFQRVGASTDTELLTYAYAAAGTYLFSEPELYIPLIGHNYDVVTPANDATAGRLYVAPVGTADLIEITAWGVWADTEEFMNLRAAPLSLYTTP